MEKTFKFYGKEYKLSFDGKIGSVEWETNGYFQSAVIKVINGNPMVYKGTRSSKLTDSLKNKIKMEVM